MISSDPLRESIGLCAFMIASGNKVHIVSTELNIFGKAANIEFRATDRLPPGIEKESKKILKIDTKAGSKCITFPWFENLQSIQQRGKNVTKVFINYHIPLSGPMPEGAVEMPYKIWALLIPVIGETCREIFPHLKPEESNFNIHLGFHHYHGDEYLLANIPQEALNLKSK